MFELLWNGVEFQHVLERLPASNISRISSSNVVGMLQVPICHLFSPSGSHSQVFLVLSPLKMYTPFFMETAEALYRFLLRLLCSFHWLSLSSKHFCSLFSPPQASISPFGVETSDGCKDIFVGKKGSADWCYMHFFWELILLSWDNSNHLSLQ